MNDLARNWWAVLLRGVLAIVFGILALVWPDITVTALVALFGAFALVDGVFAIVAAIRAAERKTTWWPFVVEGLAGIGLGALTFFWPRITALALLLLIAAWAIVTGVFEIAAAIRLRRELRGEWALILAGAASIVFGGLVAFFPGAGALAIVWLIGAYAIAFGALLVFLAFRLRSMRGTPSSRPAPA
jgi:uncharacterized membrane protein HdeD (DUF308 family)